MPRAIRMVKEHGVKVLVHSESSKGKPVYGYLGNRRWECEWYELTTAARKRREDPDYEHDHDSDEVCVVSVHASKEAALDAGRKAAPKSVYGCAIVQQHILEMFVEEDNVAEWEPIGVRFEVDARGDVAEI